jgi:amidohydrolase
MTRRPAARGSDRSAADPAREALRLGPAMVRARRHLHRNPELSFEERGTQAFILGELRKAGLAGKPIAGTGVLAVVGAGSGPAVALRADMDALPITEATGLRHASRRPGVMHACGHDAHVAMLLGAARVLAARDLPGRVVLLFQPAEESPPGGAVRIVESGALGEHGVRAVFGLHVDPSIPTGRIGLRAGPLMAASDEFEIVVRGRGGHGARPHLAVDPVVAAAHVVTALQTLVSRRLDPAKAVVVTVGMIHGGTKNNIIADEVRMSGTARSLDEDVWARLPSLIEEIASGAASGLGASCGVSYERGYPILVNDAALVSIAESYMEEAFGPDAVTWLERPLLASEDFSFYARAVPAAFLRLGTGNPAKGTTHPWHSSSFDLDEDALPIGAAVLAGCALRALEAAGAKAARAGRGGKASRRTRAARR